MANKFMWAMLMHLGYNMWGEKDNPWKDSSEPYTAATDELLMDEQLWKEYVPYMKEKGVNTLIIDLGEGLKYECCPELAIKGTWSREKFLAEVERLRGLGFDIVPKLNFSTCHDEWLGDYSRMISTPKYYDVCKSLIDEVCQILKPEMFHLGMDEEEYGMQKMYNYMVVRNGDLWWHDLYFLQNCVEKNNARAWVWSDKICECKDEFISKMPKEIIQSCWHYLDDFELTDPAMDEDVRRWMRRRLDQFIWMEEAGFDQVPTASNWACSENMLLLTKFCAQNVQSSHLLGFMQSSWKATEEKWRARHFDAADRLLEAKTWFENR